MDWYHMHVNDALFFDNRARNFMLLMGDRSVDSAGTLAGGTSCTFSLPVPAGATFPKASVSHGGADYDDEPIIGLELDPVNCGTVTKSTSRRDSKVMLVYTPTEIPLSGCTQVDVTVTNIVDTASVQRTFHFAPYTDTEDERHF